MAKPKFRTGDRVKILTNDLQPHMVGKIGKIRKVYESFSDDCEYRHFYRVVVDAEALRGIATEKDLEPA